MIVSLLSQAAVYAPRVLVYLAAFAVAAALAPRDRRAATWLAVGAGLQLLASLVGLAGYAAIMASIEGGRDTSAVGTISGISSFVGALLGAGGEGAVVAAVWFAAMGRASAPEADPYSFPR